MFLAEKRTLLGFFLSGVATGKASFQVDQYTDAPSSLRVIKQGEPSVTRQFVPGSGKQFAPLVSSEKTPIDEQLYDSVLAGMEATDVADNYNAILDRILMGNSGFIIADTMQKNKAAVPVPAKYGSVRKKRCGTSKYPDKSLPVFFI